MIRKKVIISTFAICLSSLFAEAKPDSKTETVEFEEVTISGEQGQPEDDLRREAYPYHVTVIEIDPVKTQNSNLQEILERQASLQVRNFGGKADYSTVSIRGSSSSQVSVFIDGVEVNRGDRQSVDLSTIDLNQFERIEIYRSHAPARFGINAIGGVINLVSKKHSDSNKGNLKLSVGSFDYFDANLNAFFKKGSSQHRVFLSHEQAEGDFDYVDDNLTPDNPIDDEEKTRINNDYESYRLGWFGQNEFNRISHLTWNLSYFDRDKGLPGSAKFQAPDVRYIEEHTSLQVGYHHRELYHDHDSTHVNFQYKYAKDEYLDLDNQIGLGQQDFEYPSQTQAINIIHQLQTYPLNQTFNFNYKKERQQSIDNLQDRYFQVNKRRKWNLGYETGLFLWKDKLELSGSIVYNSLHDNIEANGYELEKRDLTSWHTGFSFEFTHELSLKSSVSRGIRVPTFSELFGDRGSVVGNSDLVPEKSLNIDIGLAYTTTQFGALENFKTEFSIFRSKREELIEMVFDSRGVGRPFNLGEGETKGLEWHLSFDMPSNFSFGQNLTLMDTELAVSNLAGGEGKKIPGIFETTWAPFVQWKKNNFKVVYKYLLQEDKFYDIANLLPAIERKQHDISFGYTYKKANLALDIFNISDEQFEDFNNWPQPGRNFLFSTLFQI